MEIVGNGDSHFRHDRSLVQQIAGQIYTIAKSTNEGEISERINKSTPEASSLALVLVGGNRLHDDSERNNAIYQVTRDSIGAKGSLVKGLVRIARGDPTGLVDMFEAYLYEKHANATISHIMGQNGLQEVNSGRSINPRMDDIEIYRHQGKDLDWHKIPRDVQVAIERGVITGDQADVLRDMPDVNERTVSNGRNSNNGSNSSASSRGFDPNNDPLAEKRAADREAAYQALRDMEEIGTQIEKGVNDTVRGLQDALGWK
jgi:hypothetical protein